ncbi:MAG TPA: alpha/beta-type small acid-soluble spore protein [Bacillales bacterium]|nr:alpha/beta-type small acid-soluble spore protein [Bacillales bacterium]
MARNNKILVPEAREELNNLKAQVLAKQGYPVDKANPEQAKYEVAEDHNIPLKKGYNGDIKAKQAGEIGGNIGGQMVREMIQMAEQSLDRKQ